MTAAVVVRGIQPGRVQMSALLQHPQLPPRTTSVGLAVVEPLGLRPAVPVLLPPQSWLGFTLLKMQAGTESSTLCHMW